MDDLAGTPEPYSSSLTAAIRAARVEGAERAQALGDLREAELARLELLHEMLDPVLAQLPAGIDLFDIGLVPGQHPRLFIDMVAFVEMGRDRRTYRFLQDRRDGRVVLAEVEGVNAAVEAVTAYIARRVVEREQMLASLSRETAGRPAAVAPASEPPVPSGRRGRPALKITLGILRFALDALGLAALGGLVWLGVRYAQGRPLPW